MGEYKGNRDRAGQYIGFVADDDFELLIEGLVELRRIKCFALETVNKCQRAANVRPFLSDEYGIDKIDAMLWRLAPHLGENIDAGTTGAANTPARARHNDARAERGLAG